MTDLRKAAGMALEALELLDKRGGLGLDVHEYIRTKIKALRQALAQSEHTALVTAGEHTVPLKTYPTKREWVGLTDDEIYDYADKFLYQHGSNYGIKSFGKAIEAKLKEKNA